MRIDLAKDEAGRQADVADFNRSMSEAIQQTIDAWLIDGDPETGGRLRAFPAGAGTRSRTITAAEVAAWDVTLVALRTVTAKARPVILPALESEDLEDPLQFDERTIRIILANKFDLLEPDNAAARETNSTLYQVELAVPVRPGSPQRGSSSTGSSHHIDKRLSHPLGSWHQLRRPPAPLDRCAGARDPRHSQPISSP